MTLNHIDVHMLSLILFELFGAGVIQCSLLFLPKKNTAIIFLFPVVVMDALENAVAGLRQNDPTLTEL